ncbi:hypothetical protein A2335_05075 [Candidatus Peregrinibacteria bacterium RIFOXYB2_FULL_32_7]|nr:MAG: hypothetical protein A2335_05075 [Candidatus Peregrinibacteria bacterium RIFOXYB2_FULL_32_7]
MESLQEKGYKFEGYEVTSFSNSYHFKKDDQSKYVWFADGEMTDYMRQITTEKLNAVDKLSSIKILRKNIETKLNEYADFYRELNIDIKSQVDILIRLIQEVDDPKLLAGVDKNMEKNMQKIKNDEGDLVDGLNELIGDLSFASHLGTEELHDLGVSNTMIDAVKNNRGELALIEENFPPEYNNQKDDMSHARELIQSKIDEIAKGSIDEMTKKLTVDF